MKLRFTKEETQEGYLSLISPEHEIKKERKREELKAVTIPGQVLASDFGEILMEQKAAEMLLKLLEQIESKGAIVPVSGFRSHAEQIRIWGDTMEKEGEVFTRTYVAKPGHSEHESGLAIDLAQNREKIDFIRPEFPWDGVCGTFRANAACYGFVLRYPKEKRKITGIGSEPWHFRYVGWPHAVVMEEKNLVLEEYLTFLRENTSIKKPLHFEDGEIKIHIAYVDLREKESICIELPKQACCQASGTNEGGIVVCWCEKRPWQWVDVPQINKHIQGRQSYE